MTVRVLIADDEDLARRQLRRLLSSVPDVTVVGECASGDEAVRMIADVRPDLVLLDIQMPRLDGFGVIAAVGPAAMPAVVFVTAYDEYAIAALRAGAADYLLKPVEPAELRDAVTRARARAAPHPGAGSVRQLEALLERRGARYLRRFTVGTDGRLLVVEADDVDWIEARDNYAALHTARGTHVLRTTLAALADQLDPARFARIHRSTIVNLSRVREVQPWFRGQHVVLLGDGTRLTVGPTHKDTFLRQLQGLGGES